MRKNGEDVRKEHLRKLMGIFLSVFGVGGKRKTEKIPFSM
jgi:hypothetical protein